LSDAKKAEGRNEGRVGGVADGVSFVDDEDEAAEEIVVEDDEEIRDVKYLFSGTRTSDARWAKCNRNCCTARASGHHEVTWVGRQG
jgi:hypothetical protein